MVQSMYSYRKARWASLLSKYGLCEGEAASMETGFVAVGHAPTAPSPSSPENYSNRKSSLRSFAPVVAPSLTTLSTRELVVMEFLTPAAVVFRPITGTEHLTDNLYDYQRVFLNRLYAGLGSPPIFCRGSNRKSQEPRTIGWKKDSSSVSRPPLWDFPGEHLIIPPGAA